MEVKSNEEDFLIVVFGYEGSPPIEVTFKISSITYRGSVFRIILTDKTICIVTTKENRFS